jgi:hypothetical protein
MRKQCNRPIEEKAWWSIELADGQKGLTLSIDGLAGQNDRPMVNWESTGRRRKSRRYAKGKAQRRQVNL